LALFSNVINEVVLQADFEKTQLQSVKQIRFPVEFILQVEKNVFLLINAQDVRYGCYFSQFLIFGNLTEVL